eukprot:1298578-Alexandrium_andersonii.AAC.1
MQARQPRHKQSCIMASGWVKQPISKHAPWHQQMRRVGKPPTARWIARDVGRVLRGEGKGKVRGEAVGV